MRIPTKGALVDGSFLAYRGDPNVSSKRGLPRGVVSAFTLLEVMIALGIFFVAIFAILDLTSQSLRSARRLQQTDPDITTLAAELCLTNRLEEGVESGDFADLYPGYSWTRSIVEVSSNGLFRVDFVVARNQKHHGPRPADLTLSMLLFRPEASGGFGNKGRR